LYEQTGLPVVPVALNSGQFWGRRGFTKRPGQISVSYLLPIAAGLKRKEFMYQLEQAIETRNAELEAAARRPHINN
jgi:1-acyl-sn-glycerol-3-phosphate acyltransferase